MVSFFPIRIIPRNGLQLFFYLNLTIVKDDLDVDLTVFVTFQLPWLTDLKWVPVLRYFLIFVKRKNMRTLVITSPL